MPEFRRQHYVPRFYLRLFSKDGKHINSYNVRSGEAFSTSISKACQEKYFYSEGSQLEKAISQLERMQAKALYKIADQREGEGLTGEEYLYLLLFLTFQLSRTKLSKTLDESLFEWFSENVIKPLMKSDMSLDVSEEVIDNVRIKWPGMFGLTLCSGLKGVCGIFDLRPIVMLNGREESFITSDAPVTKNNNLKLGDLSLGGLQSPGLQIVCPINPRTALLLYDGDMYSLKSESSIVEINRRRDVEVLNRLQLINCYESVFFAEKSDESLVRNLHEKYGHLIRKKEVRYSTVERRKNIDGTSSEIVKFSKEDAYDKARFSFLRVNRRNYKRWKTEYTLRSRHTTILAPMRNERLVEMMRTEMKEVDPHLPLRDEE